MRSTLARFGRRRAVQILIGCGLLAAVLVGSDASLLGGMVGRLSAGAIVGAIALLIANQVISSVRFHYLAAEFGVEQPFRRSFYVNTMSLLGGLAFLNFIGQGATRAALMADSRAATSTAFVVTAVERVASLVMLLVLAITTSLLALGGLSIAPAPRLMLIASLSVLALIIAATSALALSRKQRREVKLIVTLAFGPLGWRVLGITLAMHACMILAYLTIAADIINAAFNVNLVATSSVVMLAASFPISFGGWGIRELTAGYMFEASSLPSEAGVAMGLTVGVLSLVAVLLNVLIAFAVSASRQGVASLAAQERQRSTGRAMRALAWLAPVVAAVLVNVQVKLPTAKSEVTANLADPVVIVAGLTMLLFTIRDSAAKTLWRIRHFNLALGLMAGAVVLGFFHGWARFGLTEWALYNRLVGLGIVLCYLLTGALATTAAGSFGTKTLVRALVVSCAAIVFAEWLTAFFLDHDSMTAIGWYWWQFSGLLGNRNAFALVLVLALAAAATNTGLWHGRRGVLVHVLALGLLAWGIYLSSSRAGAMAAVALLVYLLVIPQSRRQLWRLFAGTAAVGAVFSLGDLIIDAIHGADVGANFSEAAKDIGRFADVQSDRMASLFGAFRMWLEHPVFGAGLGAFMHDQLAEAGKPLVIHNSFLWLLAEFGVVGFVAFLAVPGLIVARTLRTPRWSADWASIAGVGCVIVLAVVALTHDVAYQRVFWLLAGAFVARPGALKAAYKRRVPAPVPAPNPI